MSAGGAAVARLVTSVATRLLEAREELNRLDGVAGDGDLGLTVTNAARALLEVAPTLETLGEAAAIRRCGTEIARKAPSTAGTLIAFALMAAGKVEAAGGASPVERAAAYLEYAAASIAQRGQVTRGDRTMLDALEPAAQAVRHAVDAGSDPATAARAAASAADEGAKGTAAMSAKVGRAGWLAERAAGHEDAGARLVALAITAAANAAGGGAST